MRWNAGWLLALVLGGCDSPPGKIERDAPLAKETVQAAPDPAPSEANSPVEDLATLQPGSLPARFTALGTEPFWAAKVDGGVLLYQTPEDQPGKRIAVTRRGVGAQIEFAGTLGGAPLILMVGAGPCSDGMSDTVYSHAAELRVGLEVLKGCARPG